jgi:hypothetical protein
VHQGKQVTSSIVPLAELETTRGKARYAEQEAVAAQQEVSFFHNHLNCCNFLRSLAEV